jgi:hypothetical protein
MRADGDRVGAITEITFSHYICVYLFLCLSAHTISIRRSPRAYKYMQMPAACARGEPDKRPQVNNRSGENYMNLFERRIEQKPTFAFLDRCTNKSTRSSVACACKVPSSSPTTEAMATAALFVVRIQSSFLSDVTLLDGPVFFFCGASKRFRARKTFLLTRTDSTVSACLILCFWRHAFNYQKYKFREAVLI